MLGLVKRLSMGNYIANGRAPTSHFLDVFHILPPHDNHLSSPFQGPRDPKFGVWLSEAGKSRIKVKNLFSAANHFFNKGWHLHSATPIGNCDSYFLSNTNVSSAGFNPSTSDIDAAGPHSWRSGFSTVLFTSTSFGRLPGITNKPVEIKW